MDGQIQFDAGCAAGGQTQAAVGTVCSGGRGGDHQTSSVQISNAQHAQLGNSLSFAMTGESIRAHSLSLLACLLSTCLAAAFHCDYGTNITMGKNVFLNFNCVILDVVSVSIGDGTAIGPGVQILTADHPRDPAVRATGAEFGRPISIGKNVWIGGGALILPGVTVGDNAIIGAGAVVTKDVPAGATAVGNPARVLPPKNSDEAKESDKQQ